MINSLLGIDMSRVVVGGGSAVAEIPKGVLKPCSCMVEMKLKWIGAICCRCNCSTPGAHKVNGIGKNELITRTSMMHAPDDHGLKPSVKIRKESRVMDISSIAMTCDDAGVVFRKIR